MRALVAGEIGTLVQTEWYGDNTLNVTCRTAAGRVRDRPLVRDDEASLAVGWPGQALALKVTHCLTIAGYGLTSIPALVVDEQLILSCRVDTVAQFRELLAAHVSA